MKKVKEKDMIPGRVYSPNLGNRRFIFQSKTGTSIYFLPDGWNPDRLFFTIKYDIIPFNYQPDNVWIDVTLTFKFGK